MCIYVFISDKNSNILAFTSDADGANLPYEHGPWREEVDPDVYVIGTDDDPIAQAVRRDGFHIISLRDDC
jgi:hypothetical protein